VHTVFVCAHEGWLGAHQGSMGAHVFSCAHAGVSCAACAACAHMAPPWAHTTCTLPMCAQKYHVRNRPQAPRRGARRPLFLGLGRLNRASCPPRRPPFLLRKHPCRFPAQAVAPPFRRTEFAGVANVTAETSLGGILCRAHTSSFLRSRFLSRARG
jgi:hypothetical protein